MDKFFIAPEVAAKEPEFDERCDTWSIGIIMHMLLTGTIPYAGEEYDDEVMNKHEENDLYMNINFGQIDIEQE